MSVKYEIHPRIGVARVGNSPDKFYLAPETIGGKAIRCDKNGNVDPDEDGNIYVDEYKDVIGRIKRQAQKFKIYKNENGSLTEVSIGGDKNDIQSITWTVHLANKKPIWYTFSELQGNLEFGNSNSYQKQDIPRNNTDITDSAQRKALIIDPGPRSVTVSDNSCPNVELSRFNIPTNYSSGSFPPIDAGGTQIDSLGEMRVDSQGNLIALGGFGNVMGTAEITSFRGAGGYWDDVSDGYVMATVTLKSGESFDVEPGWLIVGSPKYAPELVNITTLQDTMYNVAIRDFALDTNIFKQDRNSQSNFPSNKGYTPLNGYNPNYQVEYNSQIKPIIERMQSYRWVADIPYLADFSNPNFDMKDAQPDNLNRRMEYFNLFRVPLLPKDYQDWIEVLDNGPSNLFSSDGLPLLPLNSGDNSVTNSGPVYKFETLTPTQYFFMHQWAVGKFKCEDSTTPSIEQSALASIGNCVGAPFSPGIETTWIVRNSKIYAAPFQLKLAHFEAKNNEETLTYYQNNGLSILTDEANGQGCEPGDMTKRMAIPWQADFHECTVQTPNMTHPLINQFADGTGIEVPPAYYVYWWPPQSPMHIVTGSLEPDEQVLDALVSQIAGQPIIPAGQRVSYQRGINSVQDMIDSWGRLGFILNQGSDNYPYFVEKERNNNALGQLAVLQKATEIAKYRAK